MRRGGQRPRDSKEHHQQHHQSTIVNLSSDQFTSISKRILLLARAERSAGGLSWRDGETSRGGRPTLRSESKGRDRLDGCEEQAGTNDTRQQPDQVYCWKDLGDQKRRR